MGERPGDGVVFATGGGSGAQSECLEVQRDFGGCGDCVPTPGFGEEKAGEGGEAGVYALPRRLCHRWDFTGFTWFTTFSPGHLKNLSEASADHCGGERVFSQLQFFQTGIKGGKGGVLFRRTVVPSWDSHRLFHLFF